MLLDYNKNNLEEICRKYNLSLVILHGGTVAKCLPTVIPRFIRGIQKHSSDEIRWLLDCPVKPGNDKMGILQQSHGSYGNSAV